MLKLERFEVGTLDFDGWPVAFSTPRMVHVPPYQMRYSPPSKSHARNVNHRIARRPFLRGPWMHSGDSTPCGRLLSSVLGSGDDHSQKECSLWSTCKIWDNFGYQI